MLPRSFHAIACVIMRSTAAPVRANEPLEPDCPDAAEGRSPLRFGVACRW